MKFVKGLILKFLPEKVLIWLKKKYYARTLSRLSLSGKLAYFKVVRELVVPGDRVIDIGANIGYCTKVMSKFVSESGKVYSIEPVKQTFELLKSNIGSFKLRNVKPLRFAVSNKEEMVKMEIPIYESLGKNYYEARLVGDKEEFKDIFSVQSKKIDSLFLDENISFIKCDVEGHELEVFQGAKQFLKKVKPGWLVEVISDPEEKGSPANRLFKLVKKEGYGAYWFNSEDKSLNRYKKGTKAIDFFFLTKEHINKLMSSDEIKVKG